MGDPVHYFTSCSAVPCIMPLTAGRHVAQASSSVPGPQDLTDRETIWDLLQEGPQDLRVWETLYTT